MRVLFVTNNNYPDSGTTTNIFNSLFFDGGMVDHIEKITVLAGKDRYSDRDYDNYKGIEIYRTWAWTELPKEDIKLVAKHNCLKAIYAVFLKIMFHLKQKLLKKKFINKDASKAFFRALKKIDNESYDVIVTISARYYQTDAVLKYCKKYKQKFLFYQVDPCGTNMAMTKESQKARQYFEEQLYKNAIAVITTRPILDECKKIMSDEIIKKVVSMEFPLIKKSKDYFKNDKTEIKAPVVMFLGSIYGGIRNPNYTIRLFEKFVRNKKIELHFVGVERIDIDKEFEDLELYCYGRVSLENAMNLMQQADFLLNIGNTVSNQVPSKIFDYISTGKPIINVCKSRVCPTISYFSKYKMAINLYEEDEIFEEQVKKLEEFLRLYQGKEMSFYEVEQKFIECTPKYCAKLMQTILEQALLTKE